MKRLTIALAVGALAVLAVATAVLAAGPHNQARDQAQTQTTLTEILGLTNDQIADLRHDGMSLAQIAEQQGVDDQKLIDALKTEWGDRIDVRVANGALTEEQATELKSQVELRAKAMVNQATYGGMRGAAVGAGPAANGNAANGNGNTRAGGGYRGNGACDGTGPNGTSS